MGASDRMVFNAPAIPQASKFKGSTKGERQQFTSDSVTKSEWVGWMRLGYDVLPPDLDVIRARLRGSVKFDLTIVDVDARVGKMLEGLIKTLEVDNQEWVVREEGKMMAGIIIDAIKPDGLQEVVKEQIAMQRNKSMKTDVFKFVRAENLVGRPVMNVLGYSADGVLMAARKQAAIWDLDALDPEPEPTTTMARVNVTQAELDDDEDEDDGLQCATPLPCSFDVTAQAERESAVWEYSP
ncbi:hypothetical protein DYB32_009899 [Aphanomyces invadans]|uniref:Uncharacterized protein n=1 Tax=Aphanomyces invadans TaxID=157072 RepID=A0A3R7A293_9STRA|nr:hypothetical protein DYB32_009899 [Aphanomyces invadans]